MLPCILTRILLSQIIEKFLRFKFKKTVIKSYINEVQLDKTSMYNKMNTEFWYAISNNYDKTRTLITKLFILYALIVTNN